MYLTISFMMMFLAILNFQGYLKTFSLHVTNLVIDIDATMFDLSPRFLRGEYLTYENAPTQVPKFIKSTLSFEKNKTFITLIWMVIVWMLTSIPFIKYAPDLEELERVNWMNQHLTNTCACMCFVRELITTCAIILSLTFIPDEPYLFTINVFACPLTMWVLYRVDELIHRKYTKKYEELQKIIRIDLNLYNNHDDLCLLCCDKLIPADIEGAVSKFDSCSHMIHHKCMIEYVFNGYRHCLYCKKKFNGYYVACTNLPLENHIAFHSTLLNKS